MEYKVLDQSAFMLLVTLNASVAFIVLVLLCVCWKRQIPKNELLGLEGMVKLKNPDEIVTIVTKSESQAELNSSTVSNADSDKRASTAAHRSLPDIPIAEANGDTGSELYETVADKRLLETQGNQSKNDSPNLKKQASVSQHSSISQADDVSSPYSRVKNLPHDYAKVTTEHPYAQLNAPSTSSTSAAATSSAVCTDANVSTHVTGDANNRSSHNSGSTQDLNDGESQVDIPAASAIAGMISASQDLPYMTPPVANSHFSGDSQDSSKGYTSISVREPLANIMGQQPTRQAKRTSTTAARDVNDSHYATVSDDSDETYAAIEDPTSRNNPNTGADIYTSGSETYAQIQPMQSVVVSVEINNSTAPVSNYHHSIHTGNAPSFMANNISAQPQAHSTHSNRSSSMPVVEHATPVPPPPVDNLRAQMHSRQASSSSNNSSSVGNLLSSPKPEKRQANSPLPPTPKSSLQTASNNNLTSGRSSVISVIELTGETAADTSSNTNDNSPFKKHKSLSPSKDIEGMYAKVMKKNKFSTRDSPPQDNSPVMTRKQNSASSTTAMSLGLTPLDSATAALLDAQKISISTSEKNRSRCNSYGAKDHGYETIPAELNRKSDCYPYTLQKDENTPHNAEHQRLKYFSTKPPNNSVTPPPPPHSSASTILVNQNTSYQNDKHYETIAGSKNSSDPGYETLLQSKSQINSEDSEKKSSDYDPNYEVLKGPDNAISAGLSDDGYAKVMEKKPLNLDEDSIDGYSKVKSEEAEAEDGYSTIREFNKENMMDDNGTHHNYASISEAKFPPMPDILQLSAASTPVKPSNSLLQQSEHKMRPNELPAMLSPSSFTSSSLLLNTSSAASSAILTTSTMSSTFSSQQTPPSPSQYESLTGSDTDPNYESVSYIQTNRSNSALHSYERLNPDLSLSDTQLSSPPRTPPDGTTTHSISTSGAAIVLNVSSQPHSLASSLALTSANVGAKQHSSTDTQNDVTVDDYFQV